MTLDARLDRLTEPLYAGPPAGFVAHRDALAREARAAGNRELAGRIAALRRPTVGAWYLNVAARSRLTALHELLRLGGDLRDAQGRGDVAALRGLAARRNPLVARVVADLTAHLAALGTAAGAAGLDEVRTTLAAALADPEVAELVARGRLDGPRAYAGFGVPAPGPAAPPPVAQGRAGAPRAAETDAREQARVRELAGARAGLADAEAALVAARAARRTAADEVAAARAVADRLAAELAERHRELRDAEQRLAAATRAEAGPLRRAEQARRRLAALAEGSGVAGRDPGAGPG